MIYKTLKKVSDYCQVIKNGTFQDGFNGWSSQEISYNIIDGICYCTINAMGSPSIYTFQPTIIKYHKYLMSFDIFPNYSNSANTNGFYLKGDIVWYNILQNQWNKVEKIVTVTWDTTGVLVLYVNQNSNRTIGDIANFKNIQLLDLTEMYGAGNEPTTVEEFRTKFPNELYDYKPYCFIKSYKSCLKVSDVCQLMVYPYFETTLTRYGITFTDNGDGTITANGTSVGFATFVFSENFNFIAGNKYYVSTPYSVIAYKENGTMKYAQGNILFTWKSNWEIVQVYMQINKGITVSNLTFKPQLFDLTEMYGVGNEPTTVEQFKSDFPNELYDYKPYSIVPSYKKSLICTTKNLFDINKVFSAPTLCFDVSSLEIGQTYTFSSNKPIMVFKISNIRGGYNSVWCYPPASSGFTTFTFVMARDENIPVTAKQYLFLWLPELNTTGDINTSGYVTDISQLDGYNLQIELGDTATEYHPYGYL